jgi:hypothetical protein
VLAAASLSACALGCAGSSQKVGASSQPAPSDTTGTEASSQASSGLRPGLDRDGDGDGVHESGLYDRDDNEIRYYGHAAPPSFAHTVETIVASYYKAVASGDGAAACALISSDLTSGLASGSDGRPGSSPGAAAGCASALLAIFKETYHRTPAELAEIRVVRVRVGGGKAFAVLRLPSSELRIMPLEREAGSWKLAALLDVGLT